MNERISKRLSLRDFQAALVERLTSASRGVASRALLGVRAGEQHWLLGLADAGEILPLPAISSVPLTQPWFVGLANIRGLLYSVVDFSAFQGGAPTLRNQEARLLLIGARHGMNAALLVSQTLGLKNPEQFQLVKSAEEVAAEVGLGQADWCGADYVEQAATGESAARSSPLHWRQLHVRALLADPGFMNIAR